MVEQMDGGPAGPTDREADCSRRGALNSGGGAPAKPIGGDK
jgi:hypothetical protein